MGFAIIGRMPGLSCKHCSTLYQPTCMECSRTVFRV